MNSAGIHNVITVLRLVMGAMKTKSVTKALEIKGNRAYLSRFLTTNHPARSPSPGKQSIAQESNQSSQFFLAVVNMTLMGVRKKLQYQITPHHFCNGLPVRLEKKKEPNETNFSEIPKSFPSQLLS